MVATQELSLVWVGDLGRQVNPGTGACFFVVFFYFEGVSVPTVYLLQAHFQSVIFLILSSPSSQPLPRPINTNSQGGFAGGLPHSLVLIRCNSGPGCWRQRGHGACWGFSSASRLPQMVSQ